MEPRLSLAMGNQRLITSYFNLNVGFLRSGLPLQTDAQSVPPAPLQTQLPSPPPLLSVTIPTNDHLQPSLTLSQPDTPYHDHTPCQLHHHTRISNQDTQDVNPPDLPSPVMCSHTGCDIATDTTTGIINFMEQPSHGQYAGNDANVPTPASTERPPQSEKPIIQDQPTHGFTSTQPTTALDSTQFRKRGGHKRLLLQYKAPPALPTLSRYCQSKECQDLSDAWGHSLASIDASSTFRVFFQNPNGLLLSSSNYSLLQDFQTCHDYGAAVISIAETNVNWELPDQRAAMGKMLHRTWNNSTFQTSRAQEPFLSAYQPGGTATIICDNWTSRVISKGEDSSGLGRWSYIILKGKGTTKVAIITAYNVCITTGSSSGETTAYKQQCRLLAPLLRENNLPAAPHPHRQFILDLQPWIESLIQEDHEIILTMDANEPYNPDISVPVHPLTYRPGIPTLDKHHDGKLSTLVATCGLKDPLALQHSTRPFPASYFRGKQRIDYIFTTPNLAAAALRSGSMPHYSLLQGDHRPYYVDFDAELAFADHAHEIGRPDSRGLRLLDPRIVSNYKEKFRSLLDYHKVHEKREELIQVAQAGTWTPVDTVKYNRLDIQVTDCMHQAERHAGRRVSKKFDWSPALKKAVQEYRYWRLRLKHQGGGLTSLKTLQRQQQAAGIHEDVAKQQMDRVTIIGLLRQAFQHMKDHQKQSKQLRSSFLESLAEAIVLHQAPNLAYDSMEHIRTERTLKQVKAFIRREKKRQSFRKIGAVLNPNQNKGISRIDIPDPRAVGPGLGDPLDPKTWKGTWLSITNPTEIAQQLKIINIKQYHQACKTPFGSGPLADAIGRRGDTPAAQDLLAGTLPAHLLSDLLPETIRILQTLASPSPHMTGTTLAQITEEEFISAYKLTKEATSSSPSGRHVGHYKAIIKDPDMVLLHSTMMSLPFQVGFAPERWSCVTDIMLEKEAGNARCHRLRILALFESDFNQAKRILIGRKVTHHVEDNNLISTMQFGSRPGRQCQSAVLNKVLAHDIVRLTRRTAAFIENDAIGCYDRLVNSVLLLLLLRLGLPKTVTQSLGQVWNNVTHFIKTLYGTSEITYGSTQQVPLFGPGQGSTCGPIFWLLCFWLIVDSFDPSLSTAIFTSANSQLSVATLGVAFVDDSSLRATSSYQENQNLSYEENQQLEELHTVEKLEKLAQHWERLLFTTGGAINMQKSHWYLMAWNWKGGLPSLAKTDTTPATLRLTSGSNPTPESVPRIEVNDNFRTLGVYLTPNGSQVEQIKRLRQHSTSYASRVVKSTLSPDQAYWSYMSYLRPRINYPLPCTSLTQTQCRYIQAPALAALLPKLHLNRHTPHAVIFGDARYGGIGLPDLYTDQGYGQLKLLIGHLKLDDETGQLIRVAMSHLQLHVGSSCFIFELPYPSYAKWIDCNWLVSIWKYLHQLNIQLELEEPWVPHPPRHNDIMLMDIVLRFNFSKKAIRQINCCRIYLQVLSVADIASANGLTLLQSAWKVFVLSLDTASYTGQYKNAPRKQPGPNGSCY